MLRVESLSVSYEKALVLWDIAFNIKEGSIGVILGSNGAGKSTILNTVSGLLNPKSGNIVFEGKTINDGTSAAA